MSIDQSLTAKINRCPSQITRARRGSVMGMMAILLPVLAILAAVAINLAHIQVTRTEVMVATDAAARAGGRAFSETQSVTSAKSVAANIAAMNNVNYNPLQINKADGAGEIQFGTTTQPNGLNGRYVFEQIPTADVESGRVVASALRVLGRRESDSLSGKVPLIIPGVLQQQNFETAQEAVAMQVDRDISLVLDRSGSMGVLEIEFPRGKSPFSRDALDAAVDADVLFQNRSGDYFYSNGYDSTTYQQWSYTNYFDLGIAPTTPFQDLVKAVSAFLTVLDTTVQEEQVSIASYSNQATLDTYLEKDYDIIRETVDSLEPDGLTAIGRGMEEGIEALLAAAARPYASKTMVVMTDGIQNRGTDPETVASQLVSSYNLTIHTVTFGEGADQDLMQRVATIGGGKHYHAASGTELVSVFEEIANNLPTILTK